jgi:hypothetical protein
MTTSAQEIVELERMLDRAEHALPHYFCAGKHVF